MDAPPLRWGIIGAGNIARKFTDAVTRFTRSDVVAIASRSAERSRAFASAHSVPHAFDGYERMVASPSVEAVYVATPHALHCDAALLAIDAGKPVLVEKPFAHTLRHAEHIVAASRQRRVFAMEAMWTKFLPHMVRLRRTLAEGHIGEIVQVSADLAHRFPFDPAHRIYDLALAGGGLLDLGVYPISFIHDVLGPPVAVSASGSLASTGVDSQAAVLMTHVGGAQSTAFTSTRGISAQRASIVGTAGRIDVSGPFWRPSSFTITREDGTVSRFSQEIQNGFEFEVAECARNISAGAPESHAHSLKDTLSVIRTLDEIRRQIGVVYDANDA
ncbi:Gfo/Idh/MocA family protein [Microbacterium xanthum]|uniref:Gfo/Idh/MocA family protein n=1 Tax=Microbacterium xanthum TaxID=3079794 RepID=UPI002AD23CC4|nr:Gfo/Idh/MocA family oxidoreductase [Microbacterium sp. KSW-48]MDZ8171199.1 Gfo/Idh/MocA family oxidoreductase [Microbacterium sp. KSW-48]